MLNKPSINDILNLVETISTEKDYNFIEQAGIGEKPTLSSGGENLKRYPLSIKLHSNILDVQAAIDKIYQKAENREIIDYFQGEKYIGKYVIEKVNENIIQKFNDTVIYAEISVSLVEFDNDNKEFEQQTVVNQTLGETVSENNSFVQNLKNNFKTTMKEGFKNTVTSILQNPTSLSNLSAIGQNVISGFSTRIKNVVESEGLNRVKDLVDNLSSEIDGFNLSNEDSEFIKNSIAEIPNALYSAALRG